MNFIPQALNLQAIDQAISFTKGCYIGQETVARAKYRGANKRAMFVFKAQPAGSRNRQVKSKCRLNLIGEKTGHDYKCGQFRRCFMVASCDE